LAELRIQTRRKLGALRDRCHDVFKLILHWFALFSGTYLNGSQCFRECNTGAMSPVLVYDGETTRLSLSERGCVSYGERDDTVDGLIFDIAVIFA
jgi:hypothetical protein